jgi:hypothetical protein
VREYGHTKEFYEVETSCVATVAFSTLGMISSAHAQNGELVWLEAENTASTNLKLNASVGGNPQFLSEGKWVNFNIDADKIATELPADGGLISYKFNLKNAGKHQIWNRVGLSTCARRSSGASMAEHGQSLLPTT